MNQFEETAAQKLPKILLSYNFWRAVYISVADKSTTRKTAKSRFQAK